ncbi:MAG: hypothetical protein H0T71_12890 [Acidobacteria bacterium]|nr:hypothetical protein [Acidobacteriota bacterium]
MNATYVHGYDSRANERLQDQADTLVDHLIVHRAGSSAMGAMTPRTRWTSRACGS